MVFCDRMLPGSTCKVGRRQQPRLFVAVVMSALAVAVLMGAGSAFTVA
eukprot:CAMPEP_0172888992 /NCGR_PEP_ID=MMETSP1075-20121228/137747_1 /TAXON_ID=2916 /ORGANISM="Ceratium fusus, Strain PA161109" /LENGTH=47 /DNA_ID= /DNA_START= /DNA_END= /DNA_ORIENTATION=